MGKFFKILSVTVSILFIIILLLSYGISTNKFNNLVKNKIENNIAIAKVDFQKINISLNIKNFNLALELIEPDIKINNEKIHINQLQFFIKLTPAFSKVYILEEVNINLKNNEIKNIKKILDTSKNVLLTKNIDKILDGKIRGKLKFKIDEKFKLKEYFFDGFIQQASVDLFENLPFLTNINSQIVINNKEVSFKKVSAQLVNLNLRSDLSFNISQKKIFGNIKLDGLLDEKINFKSIKKIFNFKFLKLVSNIDGKINGNFNIDVDLNKDYTIKKNNSKSSINLSNLFFIYKFNSKNLKIDDLNSEIQVLDQNINYDTKLKLNNKTVKINGNYNLKEKFHKIKSEGKVNLNSFFKSSIIQDDVVFKTDVIYQKNDFKNAKISMTLNNSSIKIPYINYSKSKGKKASLNFNLNKGSKNYLIKNFKYNSNKDFINLDYLFLNKDFKFQNFGKINLKIGNNDFQLIKKNNLILINGKKIDFTTTLKEYLNKDSSQSFTLPNSNLRMSISAALLPSETLSNFKLSAQIRAGEIESLSMFSNYIDRKVFTAEIKNKDNQKKLIVYSEKTKPLFGNLNYFSGIYDGIFRLEKEYLGKSLSTTYINIENFYIRDMPILADILSVASITGALDVLKGKGIYFEKLNLKYNTINEELRIEEFYGTGPSIGFIIDGRVGADNFVSLKGNMVPANTLNKIIRNIPLIGKVLTGKEGDGIFGASFKIKGKKNDLQTTVNPLKTLTPRFIQRFLSIFRPKLN